MDKIVVYELTGHGQRNYPASDKEEGNLQLLVSVNIALAKN